ncbi:MAG: hypothetical protein CMJ84_11815 [Planctomycetes bacterium]|nr:hypothetical protein [Planctomycetota bacterium]
MRGACDWAGVSGPLFESRRLAVEESPFEVDVLVCECGARREVISCITDRTVVRRILVLGHLGLPAEPLATTPPRAPPILAFGTRVTG